MPSKSELRASVRQRKAALPPQEIQRRSRLLCRRVLQSEAYQTCRTIYGYLPFNQEVDLHMLLQQALADGKQVALPKCIGTEMKFILLSDLSQVHPSAFGAPEPTVAEPEACDDTALVIVPGLVFDRHGHRIGYGGGYYDRFLAREPHHPTIALCYDFQLTDTLPAEAHDIPVDRVFAE